MQDRIEPPILLSRLLMFVFAGTLVVLFVMFMCVQNMFPLNRPEIFLVTTRPANAMIVQIQDLAPDAENINVYKQAFVMEYIRARNEIEKNTSIMRQRWSDANGVIAAWSTPAVYNDFRKTGLYTALTRDYPDFEFVCPVRFKALPLQLQANQYTVNFEYFCTDKDGQTTKKDYTIRVVLQMDDKIQWRDRMNNPLGIKVSGYFIEAGGGDPLDTVYKQ